MLSYQKLFALQRLEILPWPWLYVSATGSVIGAKRFELTYTAPLLFDVLAQNLIADLDNVGVGVDLAVTLPPFGRAYFSFYADEMELTNLSETLHPAAEHVRPAGRSEGADSRPAVYALTLQYTKIEPFTYAHYPSSYFDYTACRSTPPTPTTGRTWPTRCGPTPTSSWSS